MGRDPGLDGVVDYFTLSGDETGCLRNKGGATRPGFAVHLKFRGATSEAVHELLGT